jgi:hypothetical protein
MRRCGLLAWGALAFALLAFAPFAAAAGWRSEQPVNSGLGVPVNLGEVGDVEFWAPNHGLLITAGNDGVPAGLFAYDGAGWYRYSTVCGGHEGRIAWAGPDEFWTISDQQAGQETGKAPPQHISLCHFVNGQVVASYAEPVGQAGSYLPMDAAVCSGPSDCWFAGDRLPGTVNEGAFHLRWNGSSLTAVPSLTEAQPQISDPGRSVVSLANYGGRLFEGVRVQEGDVAPGESASQPSFLHQVIPTSPNPFGTVPVLGGISYGEEATPEQLEGFHLAGDGAALWAVSGAVEPPARLTVLRKPGSAAFQQLALLDPGNAFSEGDSLRGLATEPGANAIWVAFAHFEDFSAAGPARLARVRSDGTVEAEITLPIEAEGIAAKGNAGPVACPAPEQCWMATERGWLFHLGPDLPQDPDPALHALVTFRPRDNSLPFVPPVDLPEDDSGESSPFENVGQTEEPSARPSAGVRRSRPLLAHLRQRVVGGRLLELSFVLRAKAHVQLFAKRKGATVAKTKRYTMGSGPRSVRLRLDPERWPTKLDLQVHPVKQGRAG